VTADDAWETVVGLEVHAQLQTRSKLFCGCAAAYAGAPPNVNVCPTCLALPGALPVLNEAAVRMAVRVGLALGCRVAPRSIFARKNYFYPDLPKGYQISQYERPIDEGGALPLADQDDGAPLARLVRIHLEEDAAKTSTAPDGRTRIDFNRAGVPLLEIVGAPDLRSGAQAEAMLRRLRELLLHLGVNDGNLEEGSFRCDANVSVRPRGSETLGTRVELKNLNSIRFVRLAVEHEADRQRRLRAAGEPVLQETRAWSEGSSATVRLRGKEEAMDYRYFPDPDLPPLDLPSSLIDEERARLPELPWARRRRWRGELGLGEDDARILGAHPALAAAFEDALRSLETATRPSGDRGAGAVPGDDRSALGKRVANFLQTEVLRHVAFDGLDARLPAPPAAVGRLLALVLDGTLSGKLAKQVLEEMRTTGRGPEAVVDALGLRQIDDPATLREVVERVLAEHPAQVDQYRGGKTKVAGFFVGQVMKATGGKAHPRVLDEVLRQALAETP